jgi:agmatine deiminase
MIADSDTNAVFVADTLESRFPEVHRGLKSILAEHGIPLRTIPVTRDIWCRDYMPIQVGEDRFVQFRFAPDYLTGKYRHLRKDGEIGPTLPWVQNCVRSEIVLEDGNVVAWGDRAIVTDKVFRENPGWSRRALRDALRNALGLRELIVIPQESGDPIGHADGMVTWVDGSRVLVNDYSVVEEGLRRRICQNLGRRQLEFIELPYDLQPGGRDGIPTAAGNWMNFLRIGDLLIVPTFGMTGDERALGIMRDAYMGYVIEAVECRELAEEGGLLHCVTWQARLNAGSRSGEDRAVTRVDCLID